jgi:hypothetical protein
MSRRFLKIAFKFQCDGFNGMGTGVCSETVAPIAQLPFIVAFMKKQFKFTQCCHRVRYLMDP